MSIIKYKKCLKMLKVQFLVRLLDYNLCMQFPFQTASSLKLSLSGKNIRTLQEFLVKNNEYLNIKTLLRKLDFWN